MSNEFSAFTIECFSIYSRPAEFINDTLPIRWLELFERELFIHYSNIISVRYKFKFN